MKDRTLWLRFAMTAILGAAFARPALLQADIVHADDVIITGNVCVGSTACVSGRLFTSDLEVNGTPADMILFDNSAGADDWELEASSDDLTIKDHVDGGSIITVVRFTGGAPGNSLVVDSAGEVGFGTATPLRELHVVDNDTPTLRLEQDGTTFTPQTFDISSNEGGFRITDTTNSRNPLTIEPSTPTASLYLDSTGQIGMGTASPAEELHVRRSDNANTIIRAENTSSSGANSAGAIQSKADVAQVSFQSHGSGRTISRFGKTLGGWNEMLGVFGNGFIIGTLFDKPLIFGTNGQNRLEITASGDVVHFSAGKVHPDYVFEPSYELESIERHAEAMWRKKHLPAVGAGEYAADGRAMFKLGAGRAGMLEELEKAHIYIDQLHEEATLKDQRITALEKSAAASANALQELAGRLAALESR